MPRISFDNFSFTNRRVILRTDYNVPFHPGTTVISDNTRISATIPTIKKILQSSPSSLVIISHLGRPKGKPNPSLSLKPVAEELAKLLNQSVHLIPSLQDDHHLLNSLESGKIYMLENIRFYPEEEGNSSSDSLSVDFSRKLAQLGDCFVNDAFGCMHRAHSSIVMSEFSGEKIAGLLVSKELSILEDLQSLDLLIVGGSKVGDKICLLKHLIPRRLKTVVIGGAMVFSFIRVLSPTFSLGLSAPQEQMDKEVEEIVELSAKHSVKLVIPFDFIAAPTMDSKGIVVDGGCVSGANSSGGGIPPTMMGLDIGPESIEMIKKEIAKSKELFWNGPMGVFERKEFERGTRSLLEEIASLSISNGLRSVIGGGDTAAACYKFCEDCSCFTHISTGGGASLEFLEGKILPGVKALSEVVA